jgi:RNA polymerase sigma-70 factor (ECF subfamily)
VRPEQPTASGAESPERSERPAWLLQTLRAAVARACPSDLASQREDLVQAALLRVLEREAQGEQNQVRTASYLWRVAFSVIADELRRRRADQLRSRRTMVGEQPVPEGRTPLPELGLGIRDCLGRLAEPRRMAVLLHLQGFRAEEIAVVLHWAVKRVQNLTYRGLADLRKCLEQKGLVP